MQSGQRIRDYVLEEMVGEGGMGEVWRARHEVLQRQVAIKVMSRQVAANPQFGERFIQEARAQAVLQHPRILGVTDFFSEGNVHYLVMPLVLGPSLEERMRQAAGALPQDEALAIARDLLDALDFAHQRGIIHRDVKPSNILLDRSGFAYLTDFGIALLVGQQRMTRTGSLLGTREYMSPEQIRNPRALDHRTDVYSAGCVIYEMLAGRPPFIGDENNGGSTDFEVMEAHVRQPPEPLRKWNPTIPTSLDDIVLQSLAKAPDQRFAGCGEFRRVLESWEHYKVEPDSQHTPVPSVTGSGSGPVPPPLLAAQASRSKAPKIVAPIVAILLLMAVIVAVATIGRHEKGADDQDLITETPEIPSMSTDMGIETGADVEPVSLITDPGAGEVMEENQAETPPPIPDDPPAESDSDQLPNPGLVQQLDLLGSSLGSEDQHYFNSLASGVQQTVSMQLEEGGTYVVLAACDNACSDIDIAILDSQSAELASDRSTDDVPVAFVTATESGTYHVVVTMASCSAASCDYGFRVYKSN